MSHESPVVGQKCLKKEKAPLQRGWASEPTASSKRSTFSSPDASQNSSREGQPCDEGPGSASGTQQKYPSSSIPGKLLPQSREPQGTFPQGFPRVFSYQLRQPYTQHPQAERFHSGAKPQPGLEPHAWPFAGQLPSDELYPTGNLGHPHRAAGGRFPRQKSPSLPSSFGQYSQSSLDPGDEGYGKKDQKPKKPGKYICHYCGRACAKPSVLKKHIRSHTGERPYPCVPCGFSFKTKSNLYKHRKSHAHAIKAGLVPFSEMGLVGRGGDLDLAGDVQSDGEQSTDTDEEGLEGSTMLMEKENPGPQISFISDKRAGGVEPAYADSAEQMSMGSMKVPILIVPKPGGVPSPAMECPSFPDMKGPPHHMTGSQAEALGNPAEDSPTIKQRLALRKQGQEPDSTQSQTQNLLSPHSKGSTDSGYFSRSESAEQQISPPNTDSKSYEEIIFGRTHHGPTSRSGQSITVSMAGGMALVDPSSQACLKKSGAILEMGRIAEDFYKGDGGISGDPKQYATGPCQSSTGLLEPPSDSATLTRSNSMPTSSPTHLSVPTRIQGSQSFDEMMTSDDVFYPAGLRRLQRQAAFELTHHEAHAVEAEVYGHVPKNVLIAMGSKMGERSPGLPEHIAYSPYGTKVGMGENATRKRRKQKSVGDEEDSPGQCDSSCSGSVEMIGDYDSKHGSMDGSRGTPTGKGSLYSAHSQSDSFDTCASMCSDDMVLLPDLEGRKAVGNVISVIQHTNSLSRPNSFEKSESFDQLAYHPAEKALFSQYSEQSDPDIFEDALSPESTMQRTESMEQQLLSDSDLASVSSSPSATASPGQPYHIPHKLVRQPNIQVPEIRVTEEPDKPDKEAEALLASEPERQEKQQQLPHVVEEFQLPQRSDTLSQMPSEKLPPKKKRLRLADMDHSSGESSFESTCTSLSRSPSQESNLSYYSSFSMSFEREENLKSGSPTKQEDASSCCGTGTASKQSEFLTVPGSGHSSHHQQREMRRSSSEQAPCALAIEFPEMRSKSFDYGSLSPGSRQGEMYSSASAMKERRRGYLVRQASLSVYPEAGPPEPGPGESSVRPDMSDHGSWPGQGAPGQTGAELVNKIKRTSLGSGGLASLHQHLLQKSISEDSLQDGPTNQRSSHQRLQKQASSMDSDPQGQEVATYQAHQPSGPPFWAPEGAPAQRSRLHYGFQTPQQYPNLHSRAPADSQSEGCNPSQVYSALGASLHNPTQHQQQQQQLFRSLSPKLSTSSSPTSSSFSSVPTMLQQVQPVFATQALAGSQTTAQGVLVPVRVPTHVPSYGSVTYTSVSQLLTNHSGGGGQGLIRLGGTSTTSSVVTVAKTTGGISGGISGTGFNLLHFLGQPDMAGAAAALLRQHPLSSSCDASPGQRLTTGIPLSLTTGTVSNTDASGTGGSKRMLSPTGSSELFFQTKQQKRVKEENMYGQIVRDMSAVELSGAGAASGGPTAAPRMKSEGPSDDPPERMTSSPPAKISVPVRSSAPHLPDIPPAESFTPPLQIVTDATPGPTAGGRDSPEALDVDPVSSSPERCGSPQSMASLSNDEADDGEPITPTPAADEGLPLAGVLARGAARSPSLAAEVQRLLQFPSLRTATTVSWCFLNYTKPSSGEAESPRASAYASWCVSAYNPNPLGLSTKAALALLRSSQRRGAETYSMAAMGPPSSGKLVSSVSWRLRFDQLKPELMPVEVCKLVRKMKGVVSRERSKEEQSEKEVSTKPIPVEHTRIKIFEGGYKSNEDYVYVRGRGRGKYICEECGIRCKKPSMLKKHIRTHTDVRPYVCKFCNFAFKTKGNLTKHMKSKAHMKKCLELGVSVSAVEDIDAEDGDAGEEGQRGSGKAGGGNMADHQFSDADDSDGGDDDGDDVDDEDDEEDDYDGDSTPKSRSRSTSPLPYGLPSLAASHLHLHHHSNASATADLLGHAGKPPLFGYLTTVPSIQITPQVDREASQVQYHRSLQGALGQRLLAPPCSSSSMDEDLPSPSQDLYSPSSRLSSPGLDPASSPSGSPSSSHSYSPGRYLSPHRDLSPCASRLSPRRDLSPLRHISPKRELGVGGYRRELSPRRELSSRGHLSPTASALSSPGSPAGRDYKRDLSPRGRHRGPIRPLSPRRGLHHHHHHHHLQSHQTGQHGGPWIHRQGQQPGQGNQGELGDLGHPAGSGTQMEMDHKAGPMSSGQQDQGRNHGHQSSPPPQVLFSHLPLHSQLQVRSPFPMVPIGGIQMVHSIPVSLTSGPAPPDHAHISSSRHAHIPADQAHISPSSRHAHISMRHAHSSPSHAHSAQQGVHHQHHHQHQHQQQQQSPRLPFQKSGSDDSCEVTSCHLSSSSSDRGGVAGGCVEWPGDTPTRDAVRSSSVGRSREEGEEGGPEQEESVLTCTKAIASLCIDGQEGSARDPPLASPQPQPTSPPLPASPKASHPRRSQQHLTDLKFSSPDPQPPPHPHPNPEHTSPPSSTGPAQTAPAPKPHGGAPKLGMGSGRPASHPLAPEEREREK